VAITQHIFGVRPELGGLRVHPCLPLELKRVTIVRRCRGVEYRIAVTNRRRNGHASLRVDGEPIDGTLVPWAPAGRVVDIEVEA
jgi:cellobiose phosphorylase